MINRFRQHHALDVLLLSDLEPLVRHHALIQVDDVGAVSLTRLQTQNNARLRAALLLLTNANRYAAALLPGSPSETTAEPKYLDVPHGVRDEIAFHDEQRVVGQWIEDHLRVVEHLYYLPH